MTIDTKKATTIDEQIALLKSRGMVIDDVKKAKENLFDIGYFRLGFYWFPFEATYPRKTTELISSLRGQISIGQSNSIISTSI